MLLFIIIFCLFGQIETFSNGEELCSHAIKGTN